MVLQASVRLDQGAPSGGSPEERRATNLPDPQVEWWIPVTQEDLSGDQWPPRRATLRRNQARRWAAAANGNLDHYLTNPEQFGPVEQNLLLSHEQLVSALLTASPPESGDADLDATAMDAIGVATTSMLRFGGVMLLRTDEGIRAINAMNMWPLDGLDDGWVLVEPFFSVGSQFEGARPDVVSVRIMFDNLVAGTVREWYDSGAGGGRMGDVVDVIPAETVQFETVWRSPRTHQGQVAARGWGTSAMPRLLPTVVAIHRRSDSLDYVVSYNERPIAQFPLSMEPGTIMAALGDQLKDGARDAEELRDAAPALGNQNILLVPPGMDPGVMLERLSDMGATFDNLDRLTQAWSDTTGFSTTESADTADVASGVAIARRNARGTAITKGTLFEPLRHSLAIIAPEMEWEYVDFTGDDSMVEEDPMEAF